MKHRRHTTILKCISLLLLWACSEDGAMEEGPDKQAPLIEVISSTPQAGKV